MTKSIFTIAAVSVAFAGAVAAQAPATSSSSTTGMAPLRFNALDTNHDGRVSRDELKSHADVVSSFDTLDANHDTYLSEGEFGKWKGMSAAPGKDAPGMHNSSPNNKSSMSRPSTDSSSSGPNAHESPATGSKDSAPAGNGQQSAPAKY